MKRLLAIILTAALLLCFAPVLNLSAAASDGVQAGLPVVVVRGMDFDALTIDPGDGSSTAALDLSTQNIVTGVLKAVGTGLLYGNPDKGVDSLLDYANDLCRYIPCDKNGVPLYASTIPTYPLAASNYPELSLGGYSESNIVRAAIDRYGAEHVYYVAYDWRVNPLTVSDQIAASVDRALTESGTDKVNLICASLGGIETVTYMSKYGYEKLNKVIFVSSTFCGVYLASDLLTGGLSIGSSALYNTLLDGTKDDETANAAVKLVKMLGVIGALADVLNGFIGEYKEPIYKDFIRDKFGYIPSFWALVLPEDYDTAINFMFGDDLKGNKSFIAIADELHQMALGRDALLREASENGVGIAVIAGYNTPNTPLYMRAEENGDGTLETALMAGKATVAPYGQTLPDGYSAADPSMLSADRVIDVTGCLFPDSTWLVKDGSHVGCGYGSRYSDFLFWLVDFDGQPTVTDNAAYPRFMIQGEGSSLSPLQ